MVGPPVAAGRMQAGATAGAKADMGEPNARLRVAPLPRSDLHCFCTTPGWGAKLGMSGDAGGSAVEAAEVK